MPISFTRAQTVAPGDAIKAPQFATLAKAFNDRLKSGLGDGPWRIFFYWFSLFREVRNPDQFGNSYPSLAEFFEVYQHVEPTESEWPIAGPGQPEGANLASQMNAFVFGALNFGLDDEATRLATFPWAVSEPTDREAWLLAQAQRGAWDPRTGGIASPSFKVAREHWRIRYTRSEAHGNSYGGYDPTPDTALDCAKPTITNYKYRFTRIDSTEVKFYPGVCPENPDDVAGIVTVPWAYYVIMQNGNVDILPSNEWVEGPYYGAGVLQKQDNQGVSRMLNTFAREFRGSAAQKQSDSYHLQSAFDFEAFANSQYHLAPAAGEEFNGVIRSVYPKVEVNADLQAGTELTWNTGGTSRGWFPSCVLASGFIDQSNLGGSVTLELVDTVDGKDVVLHTVTVAPGEGKLWFPAVPWTPVALRVRLASDLKFKAGGGSLSFEFTELMKYKPGINDLALFLRVGTVSNGTPDGAGTDETQAKTLSDSYVKKGCCWNIQGKGEVDPKLTAVNRNAVWDAARRLSKMVRIVRRFELVPQYAVENGKSILWFRRHINTVPGAPDAWAGVGPSVDRVVSGDIREGVVYKCRTTTGAIYNGATYGKNQGFIGVAGVTEYHGECWEADGIALKAPPGGYSNRWLLGVEFKPYRDRDDASIWKPDVVADYFPLLNRCHFDALDVGSDKSLRNHFAYGQTAGGRVHFPESPSGYNYATFGGSPFFGFLNANGKDCDPLDTTCIEDRRNFYKSCRVYEPDLEVESVQWESGTGNDEVLKVTLTGRLHHCDEAPDSIARDPGTWNVTDLQNEPYRSIENGLREYILTQSKGTIPVFKIGDEAVTGVAETETDRPRATIYPTFRLTKLVPEPYVDGLYTPLSPRKTHFEHDPFVQMELYLRAMCEGYVDAQTTKDYACQHGVESLYDFTWSSFCLKATGNRWFNTFQWSDIIDNREGHGPLPNTEAKAAIFNQFVHAVNLLDTVRVMVPCVTEKRLVQDVVLEYVKAYSADGSLVGCGGGGEVWTETLPPVPNPDVTTGTWEPSGGGAAISTDIELTGNCSGGLWEQKTTRQAVEFRYAPSNEDVKYAIPEGWRDQFLFTPSVLTSTRHLYRVLARKTTANLADAETCEGRTWSVDGSHWLEFPRVTITDETVCDLSLGVFTADPIEDKTTLFISGAGGLSPCIGGAERLSDITLWSETTAKLTVPVV